MFLQGFTEAEDIEEEEEDNVAGLEELVRDVAI